MAESSGVRVKMKYLDKVKVTIVASKADESLSSVDNLKKLAYKYYPELDKKCQNSFVCKSFKLDIQCEDADGDLITIENDGDLKSVVQLEKRRIFNFQLDVKQDAAAGATRHNWTGNASSSSSLPKRGETPAKQETRARGKQPCRHFGRGYCKHGSNCNFSHDRDGAASTRATTVTSTKAAAAPAPRIVTNFWFWLRQQYERDPSANISFLSGDNGYETLGKLVEQKNMPGQWIDLLVKLLTREEFRLSLMRERTNKVFGLLIGSQFLFQLHGHITSQLGAAKPQDVMPYLYLIEELQSRTKDGWKEVPLDTINALAQTLDESSAKTELVIMVNRLIDHRNKLRRQADLSPTDEHSFLGVEFRSISIVPDKSELLQLSLSANLPVNMVRKRYATVLEYLETHFRLLREDCIDPLRQGIRAYRNNQFSRELRIYQQVKLAGYRYGDEGIEYVVSFQDRRNKLLEGSKRLMYGALVCLSYDGFQDSLIFGVVTGKNLAGYGATRYTVWIRLMINKEVEGDALATISEDRNYVMVESTTAYFEAYYHVLRRLQSEDMENIPFQKYLVDLEQQVHPPFYLLRRGDGDEFDFRSAFPDMKAQLGKSRIHVMQDWPPWSSTLDEAQLQALKHGLTKELSIIQGPPGTGKTYLGLLLVKLLLANFKPAGAEIGLPGYNWRSNGLRGRMGAPTETSKERIYGRKGPILVICMTNHALDQFLEGIFKFEHNLIRVGSRSKSKNLEERTLKKLLEKERERERWVRGQAGGLQGQFAGHHSAKGRAWFDKSSLEEEIHVCIQRSNERLVRKEELRNVATLAQIENLFSVGVGTKETLRRWLAGDVLPRVEQFQADGLFSRIWDHAAQDLESEEEIQIGQERERSGKVVMLTRLDSDDGWQVQRRRGRNQNGGERFDAMDNNRYHPLLANADVIAPAGDLMGDPLIDEFHAMAIEGNVLQEVQQEMREMQIQHYVDFPDVWRLTQKQRIILHQYWLDEVRGKYERQRQELTRQYEETCKTVRQIDDEINLSLLRQANVVGITTTTAARYQQILKALNSEILIVEEAAEVLEAHVLSALSPCVKHLVLIGDHLQLRPSTAVYQLGTKYKLDVSMFERLVEGGVEHVVLQEQRRMRPSFSKLVRTLYPKLKDHESVSKYEHVMGVNSNLLFFDHTAAENSTTVDSSKVNTEEAKLVVELTLYLMKQDRYSAEDIVILTMYTGQILEIKKIMKERVASRLSVKYFERMQKKQTQGDMEDEVELEEDYGEGEKWKIEDNAVTKLLPRVSSVDDFQGEEAEIIILSLVRSNDIQTGEGEGTIGFLKTSNRICVALTRAKKGMYIFGNATLLAKRSTLWHHVIRTLTNDGALGTKLELICQNHPETKTVITKEDDFKQVVDGGCNRPCEVQLECGHVCPRRCHPGSHDDVVCPKTCLTQHSDCQHRCTVRCHGSSDCPLCEVLVIKIFSVCGHSQRMKCHKDPADETCRSPCLKVLDCLHICGKACGLPCTEKCLQKVARDLPCGHRCMLPCHIDPKTYSCKEPCRAILPDCEHQCQGNCGLCNNGTEHIPCLRKCGRILPCGHACEAGCSAPCPPCKKRCQKRCFHSMCQFWCGQICVPCREPCPWQCEHFKCDLLCHEICTRPRCDLPCKRVLTCGHNCIGLCGEPCPTKCRLCHPTTFDIITQMKLEESVDTDRFHQLQDCKHLFEVTGLDTWMDTNDAEADTGRISAAVKLKECPQCQMPVWRSTRYGNVAKTSQAKLEAVKKKIFGYEKTREAMQKLDEGNHKSAFSLFVDALEQNPALLEAHFGAGRAACMGGRYAHGAVFLSFVVQKSSFATEIRDVLKETKALDETLGTSKAHCPLAKEELAVKAMLQLASAFTSMGEFTSAEKLCNVVTKNFPDNKDAKEIKEKAKGRLIAEVVQVMSKEVGRMGRWYQCPNGHLYTIGECGGAMQLSKCPDCKADVGGDNHRLAAGNRHSTIDGSSAPAWPPGN